MECQVVGNARQDTYLFEPFVHGGVASDIENRFSIFRRAVFVKDLLRDGKQFRLIGDFGLLTFRYDPSGTVQFHDVRRLQVLEIYERQPGEAAEKENIPDEVQMTFQWKPDKKLQLALGEEIPFLDVRAHMKVVEWIPCDNPVIECGGNHGPQWHLVHPYR